MVSMRWERLRAGVVVVVFVSVGASLRGLLAQGLGDTSWRRCDDSVVGFERRFSKGHGSCACACAWPGFCDGFCLCRFAPAEAAVEVLLVPRARPGTALTTCGHVGRIIQATGGRGLCGALDGAKGGRSALLKTGFEAVGELGLLVENAGPPGGLLWDWWSTLW